MYSPKTFQYSKTSCPEYLQQWIKKISEVKILKEKNGSQSCKLNV